MKNRKCQQRQFSGVRVVIEAKHKVRDYRSNCNKLNLGWRAGEGMIAIHIRFIFSAGFYILWKMVPL